MSADQAQPVLAADNYNAVRRVLITVLIANLSVTVIKIGLGLFTGALAIVADGFHSLVDSSSNLIGLAAINLARKPADDRHPYGYRRYETLGALAIGGLLLVSSYEIGEAIVNRIIEGAAPVITPLTFILVFLTLLINVVVVVLEVRAGKRLNSEILLADAKHTQTDLYITISVLLSLVGVWLGWIWLDVIVAGVVVALIVRAAFEILIDTSRWLTDEIVVDPEAIEEIAYGAPGVRFVHRIRSRGTRDAAFVDLHVKVDPGMSTSQAHAVASEIEKRLAAEIENITDALVHIEPAGKQRFTDWERISHDMRKSADGMGLGLHDLHIHSNNEGFYTIEVHLEFKDDVSLGEAHQMADKFEEGIMKHWSRAAQIITHLEPLPERLLLPGEEIDSDEITRIRARLLTHIKSDQLIDLQVFSSGEHLHAAIKMSLPPNLPLIHVHTFTEMVETDLLKQIPILSRVTLHVEPKN